MEIEMNLNVNMFFNHLIANQEYTLNKDEFNLYVDMSDIMFDIIFFIIELSASIRYQSIINKQHKGSVVYDNRNKL